MFTLPLTPLAKLILAAIISLLLALNGYQWECKHKTTPKPTQQQLLQHILHHPEQIKGCKL